MSQGMWDWRSPQQEDVVGYQVVANDGEIGRVSQASQEAESGYLVVDVGSWIFGRKPLIPASAVRDVNHDSHTIQVDLTKDEIKNAPQFEESAGFHSYRHEAEGYYRGIGRLRS
jgi:hypothetical protein